MRLKHAWNFRWGAAGLEYHFPTLQLVHYIAPRVPLPLLEVMASAFGATFDELWAELPPLDEIKR